MGRYYNKTRSPLSASLRDGGSGYFAPKTWVSLSKEQDGSAAVVQLVKKGFLAYRPDPVEAPEPPKAPEPPPEPVAPVVVVQERIEEIHLPEVPADHVDVLVPDVPEESDPFIEVEADENTVALDPDPDTESKASRRSKSRRRG